MDFLAYFGKPVDDPSVGTLFERLNTLNRPALPDDDRYVYYDWVLVRRKGVELGFVDSAYHLAQPRGLWRTGKLLLVQFYFYSGFDNVARYEGELPFGLTWADRRDNVRAKLMKFNETLHQSSDSDAWDVPGYRLTVNYSTGKNQTVDRLFCQQMPRPLVSNEKVSWPDLQSVCQLFGADVNEPAFAALWKTQWNEARRQEAREDEEIDFCESFGATLKFANSTTATLFRSITLHRNRDMDSVGWSGQLPQQLSFEDSPQVLFKKISQKPVQHDDSSSSFVGHAVWHFKEYTLHVLYSRIDNRLLRIQMMAPGTWKSINDV